MKLNDLLKHLKQIFEIKKINQDMKLEKLNFDSLKILELIALKELKFKKLKIDLNEFQNCNKVSDIVKLFKVK
tara:strand:- start:1132 stop:1350 length:219 start_codon:yes stop_codon:yes gene_type:complete